MVALLEPGSNLALPELLHHGLAGLLPDQASGAEIVAALEAAVAGLITVHPALVDGLLAGNGERPPIAPLGQAEALTPREVEVLALLAEGLSNKAIARRLHLSDHTVKYHTSAIFAKLNVSSRTEAAIAGARAGLILL
jgi:DNA-binding NarL/FixJ family response regulator